MTQIEVAHGSRSQHSPRELAKAAPSSSVPSLMWLNPAWLSVAAAIALSVLGLMAIAVTEEAGAARYATRQSIFVLAGVMVCAIGAIPRPRTWRYLSYALAIFAIVLLIFVLIPFVPNSIVKPRNGARRWISLIVVDFQPSELAKIVLVLALANYLRLRENYRTLRGLLIPFAIMFVPMGLVLVEPDLGTSMLFPPVLFAMLLAAGAKLKHLITIASVGVGVIALVTVVSLLAAREPNPQYPILQEHQVERIQGLVNQIQGDKSQIDSINYQSSKAMTIIGAGGFHGLGEERSRVIVKYNKLPEDHNDMIFAVAVNRWGFIGGALMIWMYFIFAIGLVATAGLSRNPFGRLVCVGFAAIVIAQMTVNVGMCIGLFPITGMTLPFVSYGGSSLLANFMMTGIALGVALRPPVYMARHSFEFDSPPDDPDPLERLR